MAWRPPGGAACGCSVTGGGWAGPSVAALPLPLANEIVATVVLQHVARAAPRRALLGECARVLVPGGRLWLYALNPLAPYRLRWAGTGLQRIRADAVAPPPAAAGLAARCGVAGVGPRWRIETSAIFTGRRAARGLRAARRETRPCP